MSVDPKPRPLTHLWTTAQVVGVIVTLTGFTPERWVTFLLDAVKLPDSLRDALFAGVDLRLIAVGAGVAIIAADAIYRNRRRGPQIPAGMAPPLVGVPASAGGAPVVATSPPTGAIELAQDKPSIAVLPFVNLSGDKDQEFFADGLTEDIITELSRFRDLFVISRTSSFKYKGQPVSVQQFASELGVQYVLEGSVRKVGKYVRITVQLIAASTDRHVWAERYDRDLEDIFAIQDELTSGIVAVLAGRVEAASRDRTARKATDNMAAYECVLIGKLLHHRSRREDNLEAQRLLDRAIALDPSYANAHAWKACVLGQCLTHGWFDNGKLTPQDLLAELETALALDENNSDVHRILAAVNLIQGKHEQALFHQQRALHLNPNDDLIVVQHGELLTWTGQADDGIGWIQKAMRLNPYHPERYWSHLARAYFTLRRYDDAAAALKHIITPDANQLALLAACHAQLGDRAMSETLVDQVLTKAPDFTIGNYLTGLYYKHGADREHHREALGNTGLPA